MCSCCISSGAEAVGEELVAVSDQSVFRRGWLGLVVEIGSLSSLMIWPYIEVFKKWTLRA